MLHSGLVRIFSYSSIRSSLLPLFSRWSARACSVLIQLINHLTSCRRTIARTAAANRAYMPFGQHARTLAVRRRPPLAPSALIGSGLLGSFIWIMCVVCTRAPCVCSLVILARCTRALLSLRSPLSLAPLWFLSLWIFSGCSLVHGAADCVRSHRARVACMACVVRSLPLSLSLSLYPSLSRPLI